jgi:hypothetical protein
MSAPKKIPETKSAALASVVLSTGFVCTRRGTICEETPCGHVHSTLKEAVLCRLEIEDGHSTDVTAVVFAGGRRVFADGRVEFFWDESSSDPLWEKYSKDPTIDRPLADLRREFYPRAGWLVMDQSGGWCGHVHDTAADTLLCWNAHSDHETRRIDWEAKRGSVHRCGDRAAVSFDSTSASAFWKAWEKEAGDEAEADDHVGLIVKKLWSRERFVELYAEAREAAKSLPKEVTPYNNVANQRLFERCVAELVAPPDRTTFVVVDSSDPMKNCGHTHRDIREAMICELNDDIARGHRWPSSMDVQVGHVDEAGRAHFDASLEVSLVEPMKRALWTGGGLLDLPTDDDVECDPGDEGYLREHLLYQRDLLREDLAQNPPAAAAPAAAHAAPKSRSSPHKPRSAPRSRTTRAA